MNGEIIDCGWQSAGHNMWIRFAPGLYTTNDEWQLEVPKEHAKTIGELGVSSIIEAGEVFKLRCPLDGEYDTGGNWSETH